MAKQTHLDELIDYSSLIISKLATSPEIVELMLDSPGIDVASEEAEKARERMFDYDYIDDTVLSSGAYIMVDADMVDLPSGTIKELEVYVQIVVSKEFMTLDAKKFKGVKGNRRDNLARRIDLILNGSREFGIGRLQLASARTSSVPDAFTSKLLTYEVVDFAVDRSVGNY